MGDLINGIMNNDSAFGRLITRLGILIGANVMFCLFCLPVITIVPSIVALYHVTFKILRTQDGVINPFKEFWFGFKNNIKQSILCSLFLLAFIAVAYLDLHFADYQGGAMQFFRYGIYIIAAIILAICVILFPVMACFKDTIPHLIRNAIFFIGKNPLRVILLAVIDVVPLYFSYMDVQRLPLWGFIWVVIGYAALAMIGSMWLIKDFRRFLPKLDWEEKEV